MGREQGRRVTAQDVADRAGVSRASVSLVLNGRADGMVSDRNRAAVLAAAEELGYRPNSSAVSLRSRRTRTVGIVTDAIATTAFGGRLLAGAGDVALEAGYVPVLMDTRGDADREALVVDTLLSRQVDAVLVAAMSLMEYTPPPALVETRPLLANCFPPGPGVPAVIADEVGGGRSAVQVLLDAGHRDVVLLAGTPDLVATHRRTEGFRAAMADAGLDGEVVTAGWEVDKGYAAATAVLRRPHRPTGLVCANDRAAMGAVLAAARLGLDVPRDVSVVGYDDDENVAPCLVPPLTTVALPHEEIGRTAMRLLLDRVHGREPEREVTTVACPLVRRSSVAPPVARR